MAHEWGHWDWVPDPENRKRKIRVDADGKKVTRRDLSKLKSAQHTERLEGIKTRYKEGQAKSDAIRMRRWEMMGSRAAGQPTQVDPSLYNMTADEKRKYTGKDGQYFKSQGHLNVFMDEDEAAVQKALQGNQKFNQQNERKERALNQVVRPNVNTPVSVNSDTRGNTGFASDAVNSLLNEKTDPNSTFALENNPWGLVDPSKTPNQPLNKQTPKPAETKQSPKLSKEEWLAEQGTKWEQKTANSPAAQSGAWKTKGERWEIQKKAREGSWDKKYESYLKKDETPQLEQNVKNAEANTKKTSLENIGSSIFNQTKVGSAYNKVKQIADIAKSLKTVGAAKTLKTAMAGLNPITLIASMAINAAKQSAQGTGASSGTGYRSIDQGQEYDEWNWG